MSMQAAAGAQRRGRPPRHVADDAADDRRGARTGRAAGGGPAAAAGLQDKSPQAHDQEHRPAADAGADINARVINSRTHTAMIRPTCRAAIRRSHRAVRRSGSRSAKVVKHLLEGGADPSLSDAAGETALDAARQLPAAGPGNGAAGGDGGERAAAARKAAKDATIAMLEAVTPKTAPGQNAASPGRIGEVIRQGRCRKRPTTR